MKIKQETVAFIHSVKAKLLLMGGVAIASVGILSIILVNMLGLVNKDAQLISQINEVIKFNMKIILLV